MVVDQNNLSPSHANFTRLPQEAVDAFKRLNGELRNIEPVPIPPHAKFDNPRWALAWNKIRSYTFIEYGKLVFLDSDMMVMKVGINPLYFFSLRAFLLDHFFFFPLFLLFFYYLRMQFYLF